MSAPGITFDISCFGLDGQQKLSDDRYFIFFNQPESPEGAIRIAPSTVGDTQAFFIDLAKVPPAIDRLVYDLYGLTAAEIKIVEGQP